MDASDACLAIVRQFEGLRTTGYLCPAGVPTVGYGHTGPGITVGMQITAAQADAFLAGDVQSAQLGGAQRTHDVPTPQNKFDAMVSLAFNIGMANFATSTVLREHRAGDKAAAAEGFTMWDKAHVDGQLVVLNGLLHRRQAERTLYLGA